MRRAISAAYYGVFHATLAAAADLFIGVTQRATGLYGLLYRSVDHRWFRDLCVDAQKPRLPPRYHQYLPSGDLGVDIRAFAEAAIGLQEKRHSADYDPSIRVKGLDGIIAVQAGRDALRRFTAADESAREAFLALLLFRPR
jgi:hypothetical protein